MGERSNRRRFMLPIECISHKIDENPRCAFDEKQFEYGPQWRDRDGLFRLERHRAYWTGLMPNLGTAFAKTKDKT
jgi:hypothetical protein